MEHVNTTNIRQQQQQQQQQQQHQQLQQHQFEQEQQHNENQQQFCLRWHNHQSSLLSTLPILLDQSHLTDVTISAEGRTLRAHRVVLSACSTFFMELFRALEATNHPVIIIPGASFGAIVALLTFMYSGEVNVYEEQIPMLLNLAETLGIKGLADVQNNVQKSSKGTTPNYFDSLRKDADFERPITPPTPSPSTPNSHPLLSNLNAPLQPLTAPLLSSKFAACTPLENLFLKSLQFYPNLLPQPLNFSQTALNKTTEFLAKYQQQCNLYQGVLGMSQAKDFLPLLDHEDISRSAAKDTDEAYGGAKRFCNREKTNQQVNLNVKSNLAQQHQQKDIKRIDRIVENLRVGDIRSSHCISPQPINSMAASSSTFTSSSSAIPSQSVPQTAPTPPPPPPPQLALKSSSNNYTVATSSAHLYTKPTLYNTTTPTFAPVTSQQSQMQLPTPPYITAEDHVKLQQHMEQYAASQREQSAHTSSAAHSLGAVKSEPNLLALTEKLSSVSAAATNTTKPPSNSKLYATCFICHKQLSNQYNLRVHLETHQNVRYACNVCSHVSRSKDALRKHVSYRHPGAPSPCESEARRKRVSKLGTATMSSTATPVAPPALSATATGGEQSISGAAALATKRNFQSPNDAPLAQLGCSPYLFLPNQFHLAAAAATVVPDTSVAAVDVSPPTTAATPTTPHTPVVATVLDLAQNSAVNAEASSPPSQWLKNEKSDDANINSSPAAGAVAAPTTS